MDIYHENDRKQRHSPRGDRETVPLFLFTRTMSQSPGLRENVPERAHDLIFMTAHPEKT